MFYQLKNQLGNEVAQYFWKNYRRYLDDGQIMWDTRLCDFSLILEIMNALHPSIVFTFDGHMERLTFLNVTVIKTDYGLITEIFNKDTESDTYVPFSSCHPRSTKENIPFELAKSVRRLTDDDDTVKVKLRTLSDKLERCGYPQGLVCAAANKALSLNKYDLRKVKGEKVTTSNEIPFVHTYDPSLPQLFGLIKEITSRLYTNRELKKIFGDTRILDSRREPPSLSGILQHSRYEGASSGEENNDVTKVTKCGRPGCRTCEDMLEVNSVYFKNSDINFSIKVEMNCTVRNLIYVILCKRCGFSYIGETINLRKRMNTHRNKSASHAAACAEVSRHLYECSWGFWICPLFKMKDESKIARLVKEDKLIKLLKPDLNRDERNLLHMH